MKESAFCPYCDELVEFEFSDNYRIPVSMFYLGIRNDEKGINYPIHNPKFDVDEDALPFGCAVLAFTAIKYLERF